VPWSPRSCRPPHWSIGHLFNNLVALGVAYAAFNMALGSLLVKNFFDNVPVSLDEAGILADHELRRFHRDPALFRARRLGRSQGLTATS
jgi:hypothetical protein